MPRAVEDPEDKIATKPPKLSDGVHENGGSNSSLPYAYPMQDNPHAVAIWVAQCIADIGEERKKRNLSEFATAPVPRRARGTKNMAGRLNWLGDRDMEITTWVMKDAEARFGSDNSEQTREEGGSTASRRKRRAKNGNLDEMTGSKNTTWKKTKKSSHDGDMDPAEFDYAGKVNSHSTISDEVDFVSNKSRYIKNEHVDMFDKVVAREVAGIAPKAAGLPLFSPDFGHQFYRARKGDLKYKDGVLEATLLLADSLIVLKDVEAESGSYAISCAVQSQLSANTWAQSSTYPDALNLLSTDSDVQHGVEVVIGHLYPNFPARSMRVNGVSPSRKPNREDDRGSRPKPNEKGQTSSEGIQTNHKTTSLDINDNSTTGAMPSLKDSPSASVAEPTAPRSSGRQRQPTAKALAAADQVGRSQSKAKESRESTADPSSKKSRASRPLNRSLSDRESADQAVHDSPKHVTKATSKRAANFTPKRVLKFTHSHGENDSQKVTGVNGTYKSTSQGHSGLRHLKHLSHQVTTNSNATDGPLRQLARRISSDTEEAVEDGDRTQTNEVPFDVNPVHLDRMLNAATQAMDSSSESEMDEVDSQASSQVKRAKTAHAPREDDEVADHLNRAVSTSQGGHGSDQLEVSLSNKTVQLQDAEALSISHPGSPNSPTDHAAMIMEHLARGPKVNTIISKDESRATAELYQQFCAKILPPAQFHSAAGVPITNPQILRPYMENDGWTHTGLVTEQGNEIAALDNRQWTVGKPANTYNNESIPSPPLRVKSRHQVEEDRVYGFPPLPGIRNLPNGPRRNFQPENTALETSKHFARLAAFERGLRVDRSMSLTQLDTMIRNYDRVQQQKMLEVERRKQQAIGVPHQSPYLANGDGRASSATAGQSNGTNALIEYHHGLPTAEQLMKEHTLAKFTGPGQILSKYSPAQLRAIYESTSQPPIGRRQQANLIAPGASRENPLTIGDGSEPSNPKVSATKDAINFYRGNMKDMTARVRGLGNGAMGGGVVEKELTPEGNVRNGFSDQQSLSGSGKIDAGSATTNGACGGEGTPANGTNP